jgi:hypothetical protein
MNKLNGNLLGNKLTGWHRLWIFIAIVWGGFIIVNSIVFYHLKTTKIYESWYFELYQEARTYHSINKTSYSVINNSDLSYYQLIPIIEKKIDEAHKANPFLQDIASSTEEIRKQYQQELHNTSIFSYLRIAFLTWIIPLITIYILALVIRWVIQGFK